MTTTNETEQPETFKVRVYREHPEWAHSQQWFQMGAFLLNSLHVADYVCSDNSQLDRELHIAEIRTKHPNCVLIY